jgi:4-deoxy-L-threo-5-hexosulose-uronate ketol-isomerase
MGLHFTTRLAVHPDHCERLTTAELRKHFLIENLFVDGSIQLVYTQYDRMIVGGIKPGSSEMMLEVFDSLKSDYFLERREIGIINVGEAGEVRVGSEIVKLDNKEALYVGQGIKEVHFSNMKGKQALFYFNSSPAHASYPVKKVTLQDADTVEIGSSENANQRTIRKLIVQSKVKTCQLQMGLTELKQGSVWNTMPPHTHDRRMEAYFYFDIREGNTVSHFMGEPTETRHLWVKNNQAVISPPWSIHSGCGTSNYAFIWGMAGENLDYTDMDQVSTQDLR